MAVKNPGLLKKWMYVALSLLIVPALFAIIFTINCAKEPEPVVASQDTEADTNQALPEPNQQPEQERTDPNDKKLLRPEHKHPAFKERTKERAGMVARQIQARDVKDPNALKAMRIVPRHAFIRPTEQRYAYADYPLPIGYDQTISQPYIVAFMTEALQLKPNSKVLEIGTGSGYQAAVCAEIAQQVYTIEIVEGLAELKPGGRMILPVEGSFGFQHLVVITKDDKGNLRKRNVMPVRFVPMTGEVMKPEKESEK